MNDMSQNYFAKCSALLYAAEAHARHNMEVLARAMGFAHVLDLTQLNAVPARTLPFYFLHADLPNPVKLRLMKGLRSSEELRRRYAPIVCVLPHGPRHLMIAQVEMGFDEVVFLTDPIGDSARTLAGQLNQELLYIEAPNYFGPDRRRLERVSRGDPRRIQGGTLHHRIQVTRDPERGIRATYER